MSQPGISKHLKMLEPKPLAEASVWIEKYRDMWESNFERLDARQAPPRARALTNAPGLLREPRCALRSRQDCPPSSFPPLFGFA